MKTPAGAVPANNLKAWRVAAGLTQANVEKILGWPHARLSHLEVGSAVITAETLDALAPLYNCQPAELLEPPPPELPRLGEMRAADPVSALHETERRIAQLLAAFNKLKDALAPTLAKLDRDISALDEAAHQAVGSADEARDALLATAALFTEPKPKRQRKLRRKDRGKPPDRHNGNHDQR